MGMAPLPPEKIRLGQKKLYNFVKRGFLTCRDIFSRIISQKSISLCTHIIFLLFSLQIQICVGYIKHEVICEELLKLRNAGLYCNNLYLSVKVRLQISLVRKLCVSKLFEDTAHLHRHSLSFSLHKFNTRYLLLPDPFYIHD